MFINLSWFYGQNSVTWLDYEQPKPSKSKSSITDVFRCTESIMIKYIRAR